VIENAGNILKKAELNKKFRFYTNTLLDFFFPGFCPSCKKKLLTPEKFVCPSCLSNIQRASVERIENEFKRKFLNYELIKDFLSPFVFEKEKELQHILHSLKYNGNFLIGKFLGETSAIAGLEVLRNWNADFILPIPLHSLKKAERGYNQSEFICKGISKVLGIPYKTNILKRTKFTLSQTTMTLEERKINVHKAFKTKKEKLIVGKRIILVDDVITTGATITECARVLRENGAIEVFAFSVAVAD